MQILYSIVGVHDVFKDFNHRRRIEFEDKAMVVASVWGTEFVQFFAALAVLPQSIWINRMNSTFSLK